MDDYEGIRRTAAEFCIYLDERRFVEWSQVFTEDAVFGRLSTRAGILAFIEHDELATIPDLTRKHTVHNLLIDIDGDRATVECDLVMFDKYGDAPWKITTGKYNDQMVRESGRWLYARRDLVFTAQS